MRLMPQIDNRNKSSANTEMREVASGTVSVLFGDVVEIVLLFGLSIIIARTLGQQQFGLFCLGAAIVRFLSVVAGLGYRMGVPRFIAAHLSQGEGDKAWSSIASSSIISCMTSPVLGVILFAGAGIIEETMRKPGLADTLRIMALAVPLLTLIDLLTAHLRGVRDIKGRALFQRVLRPLSAVLLMLPILIWRLSYHAVLWVQNLSYLVTLGMLLIYCLRVLPRLIPVRKYVPVTRDLLIFSLPLWGGAILQQLLQSTDTFVVGYLSTSEAVGLYNSAARFGRLIQMVPASAAFIFLPVAAHLISLNKMDDLGRIYAITTKWVFIFSLPFSLYLFFGAAPVLGTCFGQRYVPASLALQLLSVGSTLHVLFGLNAMVCIALGMTQHFFWSQVASVAVNLILDIILVPLYGIAGAALASSVALTLSNVLLTIWVYRRSKAHPFTPDYLRLIAMVFGLGGLLAALPAWGQMGGHVSLVVGVASLCVVMIGVSRTLTAWDAAALGSLERRITGRRWFTDRVILPLVGGPIDEGSRKWAEEVFGRGPGRAGGARQRRDGKTDPIPGGPSEDSRGGRPGREPENGLNE